MSKTAVAEYMDYATIHGLGRTKNSPFTALRILWIMSVCASLGMITWQVVNLHRKYDSHPVSTSMEIKIVKKMKFPKIVICNTNLINYYKFSFDSELENILLKAAYKHNISMDMYTNISFFGDSLFTYDSTNIDNFDDSTDLDADIMVNTAEKFKMRLSSYSEDELKALSQPYNKFVLTCTFAGKSCSRPALGKDSIIRTYDYGLCYVFDPEKQAGISPSGEVSSSGQRYGLELLLNVDQYANVPFVTSSSGVVIYPLYDVGEYLDANALVYVPPGFKADIAVSQSEYERVPGKNDENPMCDVNSNASVHDCIRKCRQENIAQRCSCYQHFFLFKARTFDNNTDIRPCDSDEDYECILRTLDEFTNSTPSGCKCNNPCREEFYTSDVALISWPNEKYLPILLQIIRKKTPWGKEAFDRNTIRDNLLLVRIYLKTLSYEVVKESYAYEIANFLSDIGGQLGLWAGFSVLSILELVELVFLLVAKKDNQTKSVRDETEDKYTKQGTHETELSHFD
ncbi:hypothetical protein DPMN_103464 [Dreissena polymorpha]|uniref:Uncharacterized protein n=1 Tax=Dreissena polymorpha TaxID=45954 RepID=A0A9D4K2N2_DREPO|nr:hypothetical protein DPMN_103464 [Dreissena polymorpha]